MTHGTAYSMKGKSGKNLLASLDVSDTAPQPYSSGMPNKAHQYSSALCHDIKLRRMLPLSLGINLLLRHSLSSSDKKWYTCAGRVYF